MQDELKVGSKVRVTKGFFEGKEGNVSEIQPVLEAPDNPRLVIQSTNGIGVFFARRTAVEVILDFTDTS